MKSNYRNRKTFIAGIVIVLLLVIGVVLLLWEKPDQEDDFMDPLSQSELDTVEFEGKRYRYNRNLFNILFLGIDNNEEMLGLDIPGEAGQSDCIMILSLNKETKEGRILQIPRDTMTEIDLYDGNGNRYDSIERQIALQYAYGIGGENSCWATKKTVSELLYALPIDGYLALDIASLSIINDAVGGVTLTIPQDYTMIDPAFEKGVTLTLTGEQAHSYVRYRDIETSFSNQDRMERQLQYIPALIDAIKQTVGSNEKYYDIFYPLVSEYMVTDLREDQIDELADFDLVAAEMDFLPGEWVSGEKHDEYHVDDEKLQKKLIETFYILEK